MSATLSAQNRGADIGKSYARKIRRDGLIPAVVYSGGGEAKAITIDPNELVLIFRKSGDRNTVVTLDVDGESIDCLVREVQRNPLTRDVLHADFYRVSGDDQVEVEVPLKSSGTAVGMAIGGRLRIIRRTITVRCQYQKIPSEIVYDITDLEIGDIVTVSQLTVPAGTEALYEHDFNVLTIYGRRVTEEES